MVRRIANEGSNQNLKVKLLRKEQYCSYLRAYWQECFRDT